jgi:hypothetical protein
VKPICRQNTAVTIQKPSTIPLEGACRRHRRKQQHHAEELGQREFHPEVVGEAELGERLKEWAYAGFAITLGSALIPHRSVGDGPEAWGFAAATSVLWGLSYFFWRRLEAMPASA